MKRLFTGLVLVLALATAADVWANPQLYSKRWQNKSGWTQIDSIGWRARGGRYYNSTVDTLTAALKDTSCPYPIDGAADIQIAVWNKKNVGASTSTYTIQVSDDTVHWSSLTASFTLATTSATASDTAAVRSILASVGADSSASGFGQAIDRRRVSAAAYLRVIISKDNAPGNDTVIHCGVLKVRYPRDPKTR